MSAFDLKLLSDKGPENRIIVLSCGIYSSSGIEASHLKD